MDGSVAKAPVNPTLTRRRIVALENPAGDTAVNSCQRVRVNGKVFARGRRRLRIQGVTYGPFSADEAGHPFPSAPRIGDDFDRMGDAGINAVRTYHVPPPRLLEAASQRDLAVLVDIPWSKHLCFL